MNPMNADTPLWQQPEGKQLEFKRDLSSPQNVLKTLPEPRVVDVTAKKADGTEVAFKATVRVDTPTEGKYFEHGGILQYVLRQLAK